VNIVIAGMNFNIYKIN